MVRTDDLRFDFHEVRRGSVSVLRQVRACCKAGTLHAVVGPNGAGKSTLLRALAGLDPSTGSILLGEQTLHDAGPEIRARALAWVPQVSSIPEGISVAHSVSLARAFRGESRATVHEMAHRALVRCGIEDLAARTFSTLSAGQRQRAAIARALATEAPVVLLDEPFSALDLRAGLLLDALLQDLARTGAIVLVVLHDLGHAARIADCIHVLAGGTLVASGPPDEALSAAILTKVWGVHTRSGTPCGPFELAGPP